MKDPIPMLIDSFDLACDFLGRLDPANDYRHQRPEPGPVPPTPKGYALQQGPLTFQSPFFCAYASVPFSCYSADRVLLCESVPRPDLLKPSLIKALWLHLNIACLLASENGLTPEALLASRIQPCLVGLKPAPHECFPLALAALRAAFSLKSDLESLPF